MPATIFAASEAGSDLRSQVVGVGSSLVEALKRVNQQIDSGLSVKTEQWLDIHERALRDVDRIGDALRHLSLRTDILPGDRQWARVSYDNLIAHLQNARLRSVEAQVMHATELATALRAAEAARVWKPLGTVLDIYDVADAARSNDWTKVGEAIAGIAGTAAGGAIGVWIAGLLVGAGVAVPTLAAIVVVGAAAWGVSELFQALFRGAADIPESLSTLFETVKRYVPRRDPLVLDLDSDGIETVGLSATASIFFDHDGDGIRTATGWVKPDDGFLVLDRNGNGAVDNGRELFGDATPLNNSGSMDSTAGIAQDGFAALVNEDTNGDGMVTSADSRWTALRIWKDSNQDGTSQANELFSLGSLGISALRVQATTVNQDLGNGNVLHLRGSYIRSNGTEGTAGTVQEVANLDFIEDTFHRLFSDSVAIPAEIASLPGMTGSGSVRDLREATALAINDNELFTRLSDFALQTRRQDQQARLDPVIEAWARTSGRPSMAERVANLSRDTGTNYSITWLVIGTTVRPSGADPGWDNLVSSIQKQIEILEAFNGSHLFDFEGLVVGNQRGAFGLSIGSPVGGVTPINVRLDQPQLDLLTKASANLRQSVFESLSIQTRLKPYFDGAEFEVTDTKASLDFSMIQQRLDAVRLGDPQQALLDAIELAKSTDRVSVGGWEPWQAVARFYQPLENDADTLQKIASLASTGTSAGEFFSGFPFDDTLFAAGGNDTIYGRDGNDKLFAGDGNDTITAGNGNDIITGGTGNDTVGGEAGNDTYHFAKGWGADVLSESGTGAGDLADVIQFSDVASTEVSFERRGEALVLKRGATGDQITVSNFYNYYYSYGTIYPPAQIEQFRFTDTTLDINGVMSRAITYGTAGADNVNALYTPTGQTMYLGDGNDYTSSSQFADTVYGEAGDDTLYTYGGNDTVDGGLGNDTVYALDGDDTVIGREGADSLYGGTGFDLLSYIGSNSAVTIDLGARTATGGAASGDIFSEFEGVIGSAFADALVGDSTSNLLNGGGGADTLIGGGGNDTYIVDNNGDVVTERASEGTDTVQSSVTYTLAANVENLTLTGTGAINATGNTLANSLTGNSGANRLDGGAGADGMAGGTGNDTYVVDNTGDVITEAASAGTDTVESSVTHTLGLNVENLTLTGTAAINGTGNTLNNVLTGNAVANVLTGGAGNDTLNGGAGVDTLVGGVGNDIYVVDVLGDIVTELASEGTDTVQTALTYTLGANLENLMLTGSATVNGTGNNLANLITGNTANNVLTGGLGNDTLNGGAGIDTLVGGLGNDIYVVDNVGDIVTELAGEGTDTVQSAITYVLDATLERLTLTGTAAINGTGNTLDNLLTGNSAANVLTGGLGNDTLNGAAGADTLIGGAGNDSYTVDNIGDVITELSGEGIDQVNATVTYTLAANVDNLTLTGTTAINATGNDLANVLTGNSAANVLSGGAGNDTLTDAAGANVYVGGAGNDTLNVTGTSSDRIAVARGHGADTVVGSGTAANDVLEVSNGITKAAMGLIKSGNDLVLDLGSGESVTLRNWYAGVRNVGTLKIIGDAAWVAGQTGMPTVVETLSLVTLATQFDAARTADPLLTRWPLSSAAVALVSRTAAFSAEAPVTTAASTPRYASPTLSAKSTLRTATLEPSDLVLEARSLRNLQALMKVWAPTTAAESKAGGWLMSAAQATALNAETHSPDDVSGASVICEETMPQEWRQKADFATPRSTLRTLPSHRTTAWWEDTAITQTVAPLVKHAAAVTGWEAVSTLSKESGDPPVVATSSQPNADLLALSSISALDPGSHGLGSPASWLQVSANPDRRIAVR